jgi:hypothetical protein
MFGHGNEETNRRLHHIEEVLEDIRHLLRQFVHPHHLPTSLQISQGGNMITGVPVGGSGTFQESFVPTNAALPAGASITITWTVDDPLVTLAPSADGTSVVASVDPTDAAKAFNLTATGTSTALPAPITSGPTSVPILPTPPPLPTALAVNQTA